MESMIRFNPVSLSGGMQRQSYRGRYVRERLGEWPYGTIMASGAGTTFARFSDSRRIHVRWLDRPGPQTR